MPHSVSLPSPLSPFPPCSLTLPDFYALSIEHALAFIESIASKHSPQPNDPLTLALGDEIGRAHV